MECVIGSYTIQSFLIPIQLRPANVSTHFLAPFRGANLLIDRLDGVIARSWASIRQLGSGHLQNRWFGRFRNETLRPYQPLRHRVREM